MWSAPGPKRALAATNVTTEQARELEHRLHARGLSRKASREAVATFQAWLEEHPVNEAEIEVVTAVATALLRDISRGHQL
jgi:hypothetical protein